ncbi:heat shock 70 kDa protein II-like [Biomphalaria glabrata]|uniref:Heat shock 70 kDa protein II-like n=1 Tax=Biomphalaria glabrata TaxID=6526 RepID=A0A9W2ZCN4_BIOGL|nr:heat shock 70 kDa protein II-like [Biomphalaria glabrata]
MNQKVAVGIDLGTTNCCIAVVQNGKVEVVENELSSRLTPNYVSFTETVRLYGSDAQSQAIMNLCDTIFDVKQIIGRQIDDEIVQKNKIFWPFEIKEIKGKLKVKAKYKKKEELFAPEEISAMVLTTLKETAEAHVGQKIKDVVISVPANFNDLQRVATLNAGKIAGLNVLKLINEPTAAALTFGWTKDVGEQKTILIFDFGSCKLDVSIVNIRVSSKMEVEVKATAGDNLGGTDINRLMVLYLMELFNKKHQKDMSYSMKSIRRLFIAWEKAKIILSSNKETSITVDSLFDGIDFCTTITRAKFEEVCDDLLTSILLPVQRALHDARLDKSQIDEIVLVGGSTRIPRVQQLLSDSFGGKQLNKSLNADEAVAYGAALQAETLSRDKVHVSDIIPYDLVGVDERGCVLRLYEKGSNISQNVDWEIPTTHDTKKIHINFFQSSRFNRVELGSVTLNGTQPKPMFKLIVPIAFVIDCNGIFNVYAFDTKTSDYQHSEIRNERCRFSKKDLEQMLCKLEKYKLEEYQIKEQIEAKIHLQKCAYSFKRDLDAARHKMQPERHTSLTRYYNKVQSWLDTNSNAKEKEIERQLKSLQKGNELLSKETVKVSKL